MQAVPIQPPPPPQLLQPPRQVLPTWLLLLQPLQPLHLQSHPCGHTISSNSPCSCSISGNRLCSCSTPDDCPCSPSHPHGRYCQYSAASGISHHCGQEEIQGKSRPGRRHSISIIRTRDSYPILIPGGVARYKERF